MVGERFKPDYEITGKDSYGRHANGDKVEIDTGGIDRAGQAKITRVSAVITVLVSGLALFSDGYNAQIVGDVYHLHRVYLCANIAQVYGALVHRLVQGWHVKHHQDETVKCLPHWRDLWDALLRLSH